MDKKKLCIIAGAAIIIIGAVCIAVRPGKKNNDVKSDAGTEADITSKAATEKEAGSGSDTADASESSVSDNSLDKSTAVQSDAAPADFTVTEYLNADGNREDIFVVDDNKTVYDSLGNKVEGAHVETGGNGNVYNSEGQVYGNIYGHIVEKDFSDVTFVLDKNTGSVYDTEMNEYRNVLVSDNNEVLGVDGQVLGIIKPANIVDDIYAAKAYSSVSENSIEEIPTPTPSPSVSENTLSK